MFVGFEPPVALNDEVFMGEKSSGKKSLIRWGAF